MLSNMGASLIKHGRITTTLAKAKALRPFIEKVITKAKRAAAFPKDEKGRWHKDALHQRRLALRKVRDQEAVALLFDEKVTQFLNRSGGDTRIYKLAPRRLGDAAPMALIEFVAADDPGHQKRRRKGAKASKAAAPATDAPAPEKPAAPAEGTASG